MGDWSEEYTYYGRAHDLLSRLIVSVDQRMENKEAKNIFDKYKKQNVCGDLLSCCVDGVIVVKVRCC